MEGARLGRGEKLRQESDDGGRGGGKLSMLARVRALVGGVVDGTGGGRCRIWGAGFGAGVGWGGGRDSGRLSGGRGRPYKVFMFMRVHVRKTREGTWEGRASLCEMAPGFVKL